MSKFLADKYTREQVDTDLSIWLRAIAVALKPIFGAERALGLLGLGEPGATTERSAPTDAFLDHHDAPGSWQLNVHRFAIAGTVTDFHRFATSGQWDSPTDIIDAAIDAAKLLELMESCISDEFDRHPSGALEAVLHAGLLRKQIHEEGDDLMLSLQQVAYLAGVAEKTVRLNTDKKLPDRLPTTKAANGRDVLVMASDAIAWIDRKFGFPPTRIVTESPLEFLRASTAAQQALARELQQVATDISQGAIDADALRANPVLAKAVERAANQ